MERLTTRNIAGVAVYKYSFECERCGETIWRLPDYGNGSPTDKLAAYEDAEEHNGYTVTNKKTNADRIRSMTDEELLDFICSIETYDEGSAKTIEGGVAMCSVTEVEQWLKAESEE